MPEIILGGHLNDLNLADEFAPHVVRSRDARF